MDISSVSSCYVLKPLQVRPDQLLLDPTNPRIVLDVDTNRRFTFRSSPHPMFRNNILSVINKQAHHIAELIRGIRASGFIDKGDDMIVKRIPRSDKWLVIEGNRRTTAIKHLLNDEKSLSPVVRATLVSLHVKEFVYKPSAEFSEEAVIDILLGTIHITGRLPWGALERAYYIHNSYLRELLKHTERLEFEYNTACSKEVATFFNLSVKEVRKQLIVYKVYEQLRQNGYDVAPRHFSLIDMAVTDRNLSQKYFELDPVRFRFSKVGLSRFNKLCIREKKAVNNPKDFRKFSYICKHGTDFDVGQVELNDQALDIILDRINSRLDQREFLNQLEAIQVRLGDLPPSGFRGTKAEIEAIRKLKRMVDELCDWYRHHPKAISTSIFLPFSADRN